MPHLSADLISAWVTAQGDRKPTDYSLDGDIVSRAGVALNSDARGLLYTASVSFLSALEGIQTAQFSWSAVKLYYCCFYAARSILASNKFCLFYSGTKPYSVLLGSGNKPRKEDGTTHKVVWKIFSREFPMNTLLNEIEGMAANSWMAKIRETANYKNARFPDPLVPDFFAILDSKGMDRTISEYINDTSFLYALDPDHAAVAFPLECVRQARNALQRSYIELDDEEMEYINICRDRLNLSSSIWV